MKLDSPLFNRIRVKPEQDRKPRGELPVCQWPGCEFEAICPGVRDDYLAHFGDAEIALARGLAASRVGRVRLPVV